MISISQFMIPFFCLALFLLFLYKWWHNRASTPGKRLPPSPRKLPVIGNLHQLGLFPHRSFQSLSKRYGPLMLLHFGHAPVLVVSSADAAREIMKNQDVIFSSRPNLSIPGKLLYASKDVGFAPYGEYWRKMRSICVLQLLSHKRVQSFRRVREEETSLMVETIRQLASSSSVVNLSNVLGTLTNDVICRAALGRKYSFGEEGKKFRTMLREILDLLGTFCVRDCMPWLAWIDRLNGLDGQCERMAKMTDEFLESVVEERRSKKKGEKAHSEVTVSNFVDILLEVQRENKDVDNDAIKAIVLDVFGGGTDTTATALEWTIAELIKNPRAMRFLQKEVREVAGSKEEIDEEDIDKMHYLKAVFKESLRLHPPVPLLVPRESTQDTKVMGFDVAAGTQVMINAWSISRDPSLWENPEEFQPERFLNTSIDFRGLHFELIPFGAGRRGCPGITFATSVNELALAKLVHKFDFDLPNGASKVDLDMAEATGLTIHKRSPLLLLAKPYTC